MGQVVAAGLRAAGDFEVVALVDPSPPLELASSRWLQGVDEIDAHAVDVVIDFSRLDVARTTVAWALTNHVAVVVGTSGFGAGELEEIGARARAEDGHVLIAANFSIGAVLAERFAAVAAPYFDRVEIVELHHDRKIDAPSGTSMATAHAIADARAHAGLAPLDDVTERESLPNARGAEGAGGVRIHSVRLPGLVAHQEVIFGRAGEGLVIRHDSYARESFVAGVALAARRVRQRPGLTLGLDALV